MQVLNLIRPENSDIKYDIIQFPDGEPHIVLKEINRKDDVAFVPVHGVLNDIMYGEGRCRL